VRDGDLRVMLAIMNSELYVIGVLLQRPPQLGGAQD
jgi:hypothetical protein